MKFELSFNDEYDCIIIRVNAFFIIFKFRCSNMASHRVLRFTTCALTHGLRSAHRFLSLVKQTIRATKAYKTGAFHSRITPK